MSLVKYNSILDIFLNYLIPETVSSVKKGNKIFGAFVIAKSDFKLIITGTNNEIVNPLFHGEISAIFNFFKLNKLNSKKYYFITSHEPCSLCLSAITWSGFDNFYYFFPHKETKSKFNIPHDLNILKEVFYINNGNYNKDNIYWKSFSILEEIKKLNNKEKDSLSIKIENITKLYQNLSLKYQNSKISNLIPLK